MVNEKRGSGQSQAQGKVMPGSVGCARHPFERLATGSVAVRLHRDRIERLLGGATQPDGAEFDIRRQGGGAEQFGERAAGLPAQHVHLEQAVGGMLPAPGHEQVVGALRRDMGDTVTFFSSPAMDTVSARPAPAGMT